MNDVVAPVVAALASAPASTVDAIKSDVYAALSTLEASPDLLSGARTASSLASHRDDSCTLMSGVVAVDGPTPLIAPRTLPSFAVQPLSHRVRMGSTLNHS